MWVDGIMNTFMNSQDSEHFHYLRLFPYRTLQLTLSPNQTIESIF